MAGNCGHICIFLTVMVLAGIIIHLIGSTSGLVISTTFDYFKNQSLDLKCDKSDECKIQYVQVSTKVNPSHQGAILLMIPLIL